MSDNRTLATDLALSHVSSPHTTLAGSEVREEHSTRIRPGAQPRHWAPIASLCEAKHGGPHGRAIPSGGRDVAPLGSIGEGATGSARGAPRSLREQSVRYVKGVGPHRAELLARLGIETVEDLCGYPPRRYEDRRHLCAIRDAEVGEWVTVHGRVMSTRLRRLPGARTLVEATVADETGVLSAVWFNQPYRQTQLRVGADVILYGRREPGARIRFVHPEMESLDEAEDPSGLPARGAQAGLHMGRIVPVYPLTEGLSQRWLRQIIWTVLEQGADWAEDALPASLWQARGWPTIREAIRALHFPSSVEEAEAARTRLAFEELFVFQLALARRRARAMARRKPQQYVLDGPLRAGLRERLPFALTSAQARVLAELMGDLGRPFPMQRLLQGDVGCGKTVVMAFLTAVAVDSGYQVAWMAPTELLAEQHARTLDAWLGPLGVSWVVLSQGLAAAQRQRSVAAIAEGRAAVVIGTHALIQARVTFKRLALVIIDEQHKFGVSQRALLARKGGMPDVLVVTATPIPRTMALSLYGDLDVSTIDEPPPGRRAVQTVWMPERRRQDVYALVRRHLAQGRQGYVVSPRVNPVTTASRSCPVKARSNGAGLRGNGVKEEEEDHGPESPQALKAATSMARHLQRAFGEFRVGLLHGQMRAQDKARAMRAFERRDIHLLVSTVIVEVGLDVSNATIMVIEHPEHFGLAQLHQLRGRIGRGEHPATCVVISDATEEAVRRRLEAFVQTTDGFALAEQDLALRGPGELLGARQHGWMRLRIADLGRDRALLELAQQDARELLRSGRVAQ